MFKHFKLGVDFVKERCRIPPLDLDNEENVEGKIVLITGSNSGLGKATACEMAKRGAKVIMACRDMQKSKEAVEDIRKITSKGELIIHKLDLASLDSVRQFASEVIESYPAITLLICNAGIANLTGKHNKTVDGFESHFGVNHLGHFLLTLLLLDHLKKGAPSRIVFVASTMFQAGNLDKKMRENDVNFEKNSSFGLGNNLPYNNSKYANMLCTYELSRRLGRNSGVSTYAICPGLVRTNVFRDQTKIQIQFTKMGLSLVGFSPEKGAEVILYTALSKKCRGESGKMYRFNRVWESASNDMINNEQLGIALWELSESLVGLKY